MSELIHLEALLAVMTGSAGTSELTGEQVSALLLTCQQLAFVALSSVQNQGTCMQLPQVA